MSVLVSVLYAFSRLASENEITALKAGGVSTRSLMRPVIVAASLLALFMLYFNDQLMPRANHELATLQVGDSAHQADVRAPPAGAQHDQGGQPLPARRLDRRGSGLMRDVTIYDLADQDRRRTHLRRQRHARVRREPPRPEHAAVRTA